jgi:UDPglucose 6-dehydrogenase
MKIGIIGTGYVGLVTGTCFSEMGNTVICMDEDESKIEALQKSIVPIYEPGLEDLIKRNSSEGRLRFTTDMKEALDNSLLIFIAVGTPMDEDGSCDTSHVLDVARKIGEHIDSYRIIIDKSTVPVGTADQVTITIKKTLKERGVDIEFDVVSNPEFLKEGNAVEDFMRPDRIVVGVNNVRTAEILKELYAPFVRTHNPILVMNPRSAEMTKYAANSMLACRISLMNEISNLCELSGANVEMVRQGIGFDERIGHRFIFPGIGYGGSCFPKDVRALIRIGTSRDYDPQILTAIDEVNTRQKTVLFKKIRDHFDSKLDDKTIAIWGLSFKPQTDDIREAPALVIIEELLKMGARIQAYDPKAMKATREYIGENPQITYHKNNYEAANGADAVVLVTEWGVFREPDFEQLKSIMKQPVIFDGRNQYDPNRIAQKGFVYYSIGRQAVT